MPDLARILRDQSDLARVLAAMEAGDKDVAGVRAGIADNLLEECVLRTGRAPRIGEKHEPTKA